MITDHRCDIYQGVFVLLLAGLVVGSLVEVVVGQGHLAAVEVGVLVGVVVGQCHLAKLLVGILIGVISPNS